MKILDMLYPRRCALCDRVLASYETYLCRECSFHLTFRRGNTCLKCGRPSENAVCGQCRLHRYSFEECLAPFAYKGFIKDSIMRFKYHDRPEYARFFAAAILYYAGKRILEWKADALVPVPVHRSRLLKRGYNQAGLLAKELSKRTGIPLAEHLVARRKKTGAQKELGFSERKNNLKDAFVYIGNTRAPERVIIVDDIFTTGSTMESLAVLLRENGAKKIYGVCISS